MCSSHTTEDTKILPKAQMQITCPDVLSCINNDDISPTKVKHIVAVLQATKRFSGWYLSVCCIAGVDFVDLRALIRVWIEIKAFVIRNVEHA